MFHVRLRVLSSLVVLLIATAGIQASLSVHSIQSVTAFPAGTVPVDGFVPLVVMGVTDDGYFVNDILDSYEPQAGYRPAVSGSWMSGSSDPSFSVVLFDTGANANLLSYADWNTHDLLDTGERFEVEGAGPGSIDAAILQAYGFFIDGLGAIGQGGTVDASGFRGVSNVRPLAAASSSDLDHLPSVIGTPLSAFYTTVIRTDQVYTAQYAGDAHSSPNVEIFPSRYADDVPQLFDHRIDLTYRTGGQTLPPVYVVSDGMFGVLPATPTVSEALMIEDVQVEHSAYQPRTTGGTFLLDTGAQVTVISRDKALDLALNVDQPEFTVEITGVGGSVQQVPGFTLDTLRLPATGLGDMVLHDVPVVVLNVPNDDQPLDGIIGMNLFTDRNLVIHGGYGPGSGTFSNPFIGITAANPEGMGTDFIAPTGSWSDPANWDYALPDATIHAYVQFDRQAVVTGQASAAGLQIGRLGYGHGGVQLDAAARLELSEALVLGHNAELTAAQGAEIRLAAGARLENYQSAPAGLEGLARVALLIQGGPSVGTLEVASRIDEGLVENFAIARLEVGSTGPGGLELVDAFDNRQDGPGNEILAAGTLVVSAGSVLDLGSTGLWLGDPAMTLAVVRDLLADGRIVSDRAVSYGLHNGGILLADAVGADLTGDGLVDADDLDLLVAGFGAAGLWNQGDLDYDGQVGFADFVLLSHQYAGSQAELAAAVEMIPEPGSMCLLGLAALAGLARRRRGR